MDRMTRLIAAGVIAATALTGGTGLAAASGGNGDQDRPLAGSNLERATEAALAHVGGGAVIETEAGDDGAAYGVEIRLDDGRVMEVNLDARFQVIGAEQDEDGPNEVDGSTDH